jgi:hypothetical protein
MKKFREINRLKEDSMDSSTLEAPAGNQFRQGDSPAARSMIEKPQKEPMKKLKQEEIEIPKDAPSVETVAKKHGVSVDEIKKQLKIGMSVEAEHGKNKGSEREIAMDHLNEKPDYYTKLKKYVEQTEQVNEMLKPKMSALDKFRQASAERAKKHDNIEREMRARHAAGKEDMSGAIDRLAKQLNREEVELDEDLRKWFSKTDPEGGWKRINSKGEAIGPCAREPGEPKPKCMSNEKRAKLSKKERASAVATKRKHDPNPERTGKPINVSNFGKGKISEDMENLDEKNVPTSPEKWAQAKSQAKAKFDVYPSAYANGWASKKYKEMGGGWKSVSEQIETDDSEKSEMAQTQLHFIKYAAEEILEYINMGGKIEEWYQNKLSKVQSEVESLHSYVEGESRRTGMKEEVEQIEEGQMKRMATDREEGARLSKVPFDGPYTKVKDTITDKSGAKHSPMSRARDLARSAALKQTKKLQAVKEEKEDSRKAEIVKDVIKKAKKKKSETTGTDKFEANPVLSSEIQKQ